MLTGLANILYMGVFSYCERAGLIKQLKKAIKIPEQKRFKKLHISKKGLDILDAVHCVYDKPRTEFFLNEIDKNISRNQIVVEAGIGTGILSFFAASRAKNVFGIEINKSILKLALDIQKDLIQKKKISRIPTLVHGDATNTRVPFKKIDMIISENIYTGMFYEKQVQIMDALLPYLRRGGIVIPEQLHSFIELSHVTFNKKPRHMELLVPSPQNPIPHKPLSSPIKYDVIDFRKNRKNGVRVDMKIPIICDGECNSVSIYSEVKMPSGSIIRRNDTTFLNSDIILAISPMKVTRGEIMRLRFSYVYGGNPSNALLKVDIMK